MMKDIARSRWARRRSFPESTSGTNDPPAALNYQGAPPVASLPGYGRDSRNLVCAILCMLTRCHRNALHGLNPDG